MILEKNCDKRETYINKWRETTEVISYHSCESVRFRRALAARFLVEVLRQPAFPASVVTCFVSTYLRVFLAESCEGARVSMKPALTQQGKPVLSTRALFDHKLIT